MARSDPRGADRRGNDYAGLGYDLDAPTRIVRGKRWPAPADIAAIIRYTRQRVATGRCVVCHTPTTAPGVTCKATNCISAWVLGHEE